MTEAYTVSRGASTQQTALTVPVWFQPPPGLTPRERWFYTGSLLAYLCAIALHFVLILLFAYLGVPALSLYNLLSLALWIGIVLMVKRGHVAQAYPLAFFELVLHAVLVVVFLGWDFGAQYYLLPAVSAAILVPIKRWQHIALVVLAGSAFVGLYLYSQSHAPLAGVDTHLLELAHAFNLAFVAFVAFGLNAVIMLFWISVAERAEAALEVEQARSEALLNNVLPHAIAKRLKSEGHRIADKFDDASILFADIANFTPFSRDLPADRVVALLDDVFTRFDGLVDTYGLEKIKTVGDAYMVAAGIPEPRPDHAQATALLALEMRSAWAAFVRGAGLDLQIRIGINSGPVVAGVIGKRRFLYDLWGDAVNTAARMEAYGVPGEIQVTENTYALLRGTFAFEERGMVEIKGKGPMRTYLLRGPLP
jgi:class 3 adenylate cyclase